MSSEEKRSPRSLGGFRQKQSDPQSRQFRSGGYQPGQAITTQPPSQGSGAQKPPATPKTDKAK